MRHISEEEQYKRMTETPIPKMIITLGIPTIISMLVTNIYSMADTYFVGTIGTSASGATGVVFSLMAILQAFGFMFGHGAGSNISRRLGQHQVDHAIIYASTSFFYSIAAGLTVMILGLLFMDPLMRILGSTDTILPYARTYALYILLAGPAMTSSCVMNNILRYEGKAFFAMLGLTSGGILNIFLDALFVGVWNMGIGGAGLATMISQYISCVILLIPYLRGQTQSRFALSKISRDYRDLYDIVTVGSPSLARQGLNSLSTMVLNLIAGPYGDAAVAAMSIVNRITNFLFCVCTGIGQGFQPVSAFNFGARIYSRVKEGFRFAFALGVIVMTVLGLSGFVFARPFVAFFRDDPEVIEIGARALRWQCAVMWLMPVTLFGNMLFQSIGQSKIAVWLASLRSGVALIPVLMVLPPLFGLSGLEASKSVAEVITCIITLPFIFNFFQTLPRDGQEYLR